MKLLGVVPVGSHHNQGRGATSATEGQALVLFVLLLLVLVGVTAIAVDGGYAYAQRRRMQYAADAAALAGARALALGEGTAAADAAVHYYATANGAETVTWYVADGNRVRVEVSRTFNTFFAGVMGLSSMTAVAKAEALFGGALRTGGLLPIAVEEFDFQLGQTYTLWDKDTKPSPGNFGWLDWNGGSASAPELADNICHPENSGTWSVGDQIPGAQGAKVSSDVRNCLASWLGQVVKLVVYDQVVGPGHNVRYRVAGFACFRISDFSLTGKQKYIQGVFEACVTDGDVGGPDYGLRVVRLGPTEF